MIIDGDRLSDGHAFHPHYSPAVRAFLAFIERKLDVTIIRESALDPWGDPSLTQAHQIVATLVRAGIVDSIRKITPRPDEPQLKRWDATYGSSKHPAGGISFESDEAALFACAAETLERYLWTDTKDFSAQPVYATTVEMTARASIIPPERYSGFSRTQRDTNPILTIRDDTKFAWVPAHSLISNQRVFIPAQTVSGFRDLRSHSGTIEPIIRPRVTTGLATWPQRSGAQLRGILEIIERDAYMIMWLNQLTLPRLNLSALARESARLSHVLSVCERYMLRIHAIQMLTDAPTYAVCVVIEDTSGVGPLFSVGLKADRALSDAIVGAATEAIRARSVMRTKAEDDGVQVDTAHNVSEIDHMDRLYYWADQTNAERLRFLIAGDMIAEMAPIWTTDTDDMHLKRLLQWCRDTGYECASVSLGVNASNPLPWHVEHVVIPELQPMYLSERLRATGGTRLHSIPKQFGYASRDPYIDTPHPFA